MDDLEITGIKVDKFKSQIALRWKMEDLGVAKSVVGIHISWLKKHSHFMKQSSLTKNILERFKFEHPKTVMTPLPVTLKLYQSSD